MHHAIKIWSETNKQAKFRDPTNFTLNVGTNRVICHERRPRVVLCLFKAKRDTALFRINIEHFDVNFLRG